MLTILVYVNSSSVEDEVSAMAESDIAFEDEDYSVLGELIGKIKQEELAKSNKVLSDNLKKNTNKASGINEITLEEENISENNDEVDDENNIDSNYYEEIADNIEYSNEYEESDAFVDEEIYMENIESPVYANEISEQYYRDLASEDIESLDSSYIDDEQNSNKVNDNAELETNIEEEFYEEE
jgi:flagellar biosynthesis GTPase FlhF